MGHTQYNVLHMKKLSTILLKTKGKKKKASRDLISQTPDFYVATRNSNSMIFARVGARQKPREEYLKLGKLKF